MLLAAAAYFIIGKGSTLLPGDVRLWRFAAWAASAVVFAVHIWYEHQNRKHPPRVMALHVAGAVAIGGLGLAIAGMLHSLSNEPALKPAWLLALVLWPAITAIPAFLVAFVTGTLLTRLRRSGPPLHP